MNMKVTIYQPRGGLEQLLPSQPLEPTTPAHALILDSLSSRTETIRFSCLSHSVCGTLFRQLEETNAHGDTHLPRPLDPETLQTGLCKRAHRSAQPRSTRRAWKISVSRASVLGQVCRSGKLPRKVGCVPEHCSLCFPCYLQNPLCQLKGKESVSLFGPRLPWTPCSRSLSQDRHSGSLSKVPPLRVPHMLHRSPGTLRHTRAAGGVLGSSSRGAGRSRSGRRGHNDLLIQAPEAPGILRFFFLPCQTPAV